LSLPKRLYPSTEHVIVITFVTRDRPKDKQDFAVRSQGESTDKMACYGRLIEVHSFFGDNF